MNAFLHRAKWTLIALAYLVSPLDFVPDILLGLGWLDDLAFFAYAMQKASHPPTLDLTESVTNRLPRN